MSYGSPDVEIYNPHNTEWRLQLTGPSYMQTGVSLNEGQPHALNV